MQKPQERDQRTAARSPGLSGWPLIDKRQPSTQHSSGMVHTSEDSFSGEPHLKESSLAKPFMSSKHLTFQDQRNFIFSAIKSLKWNLVTKKTKVLSEGSSDIHNPSAIEIVASCGLLPDSEVPVMSLMATLVSGMPDFRRKPSSLCNDSVKNEHPRAGHSLQDPFTMFTSLGILPLDTHTHTHCFFTLAYG